MLSGDKTRESFRCAFLHCFSNGVVSRDAADVTSSVIIFHLTHGSTRERNLISIKFNIVEFYKKLSNHFNCHLDRTISTTTKFVKK
jgi:hypothetical protein